MPAITIAPSILASDFANLGAQVQEAREAGAQWIHVDVMDGRFVPNISLGVPVLRSLRRATDAFLDVHLMIVEPERYLAAFADAGADLLTVHVEATPHLHRAVQQTRELGVKAGVSLNPGTPVSCVEPILPDVDLVLVMSVNPGFGGQRFLPASLDRIRRLRQMIDDKGLAVALEVDGGIDPDTAGDVVAAGATVLVAGSSIFGAAGGIRQGYRNLERAAESKTPKPVAASVS